MTGVEVFHLLSIRELADVRNVGCCQQQKEMEHLRAGQVKGVVLTKKTRAKSNGEACGAEHT